MGFFPIFIQSFVIGLSGAMAPGPLLTYTIQASYKKGFWVGPQVILGHAILEALMVVGLIFGLGNVIQYPLFKFCLSLLGGLILLWMGFELVWVESKKGFFLDETAATVNEPVRSVSMVNLPPVLAGIIISLSNPFWSLWWAMVGLAYISKALTWGGLGVVVFYSGHILSDLIWYSLITVIVAKGRHLLSAKVYRWLLISCGLFIIYFGATFIWEAVKR